jgi:hypothetical protein
MPTILATRLQVKQFTASSLYCQQHAAQIIDTTIKVACCYQTFFGKRRFEGRQFSKEVCRGDVHPGSNQGN